MKGRLIVIGLAALGAAPAYGYDPASTHAGLTEKAVMASSLHKVLARRLGRPLGVLEPLQIHSRLLEPALRRALWDRLSMLDPAGGYRPGSDGTAPALAWVVAGTVLAETPPERGRNHFFDPRRGSGLEDDTALAGVAHVMRLAFDRGARLRQIATGTAFDLTGQPSVQWISSPANDLGLPVVLEQWERAVAAAEPALREAALVRGLLALGGVLAVLQDAGEPAHVRNDFRETYMRRQSASYWDRASDFERYVSTRYGRAGVPAARPPTRRPTLEAYFVHPDGQGLADRTQRRFFSLGTIPDAVAVEPKTTARDVMRVARDRLVYPRPAIGHLALRENVGRRQYVLLEGRRTLGYVRLPTEVRFFLDTAVYKDVAEAVLPEIGAYAAGFIDHLTRAWLKVAVQSRKVTVSLEGLSSAPTQGRLRVFAEDSAGTRREISVAGKPAQIDAPADARRIAAVMTGADAAGPFVAAGETAVE